MNLLILGVLSTMGLLLMLALLHLIDVLERKPVKSGSLGERPEKSLKDFGLEAGTISVSLRVARETYDLLTEYYPTPMSIDLGDELRRDLDITDEVLLQLRSTLFTKTDRVEPGTSDMSSIRTVGQLLRHTETAAREKVDRASLRLRASDCPYPVRPVAEVIEFKHTSKIMDPDYMRRAHFKWLRRRISDYKGLLSRATDDAPRPTHMGPYRRSYEGPRYPEWNVAYPPKGASQRAGGIILQSASIDSTSRQPATNGQDGLLEQLKIATGTASVSPAMSAPVKPIRIAGSEYPSR